MSDHVLTLARQVLGPRDIHVWWIGVDAETVALDPYLAVLDGAQRARAARFVRAGDRARFVLAQGALRHVLAAYGCGAAGALRFRAGAHGKPALAEGGVGFNLSHSAALTLLAVAPPGIAVGVDVERVRPVDNAAEMVGRFFHDREQRAWRAHEPVARQAAFFRLWTRKEAFIKATGEGLARPLDSFAVSVDLPAAILEPDLPDWSLHHLDPAPEYVAALAVADAAPCLRLGQLDPGPR